MRAQKWYRDPDKLILVLILLLFAERIAFLLYLGPEAMANADDVAYLKSARYFAKTGIITIWTNQPTAGIMPGTTLIAGSIAFLLGPGTAFLTAVKLLWICMGSLTALYLYRAAKLYLPAPCALLAAIPLLLPNRAWLDNVISTETPYVFFFCINLYFLLKMRWDKSRSCTVRCGLSFVMALLFRANILILPLFGLLYLVLCRTHSWREIGRRTLAFCCIALLFFVPWTIRNYVLFDAFIPVTYGAGAPMLDGSYQGDTAPADEELDYKTNVQQVVRAKYSRYFNEDGSCRTDAYSSYIRAMTKSVKAHYRIREWFARNPKGFLYSYLIQKPLGMLTWVYDWGPFAEKVIPVLHLLSKLNCVLWALGLVLAFALKEKREILLLLTLIYFVYLYMFGVSFAAERYAALIMPLRYFIGAISLELAARLFTRTRKAERV